MRRAQVSVEFVMLFVTALFVFIVAATLFPGQLRDVADAEQEAERVLREFKLHVITASIAEHDYEALVSVPAAVQGTAVTLAVHGAPDSIAQLVDDQGQVLARTYLPTITRVRQDPALAGAVRIEKRGGELVVYL